MSDEARKIYIARQDGVYWHEIVATDLSYENLKLWVDEQIKNDCDDYHELIITEHVIGDKKDFDNTEYRGQQERTDSEVEMYKVRKQS